MELDTWNNKSSESCTECLPSEASRYTEVTIIIVVNVLCLSGNTLLIATVYRCRELRTISNVLIVNLAVNSILMSMFVLPFWAASTLASTAVFGEVICQASAMAASLLFMNSILTLAGIAIDRFFVICYPFKYQIYASVSKTCVYVAATWAHALVLSMPPWMKFGRYSFRPSLLPICMNDYYNEPYYTLLLFVTTFIPSFLVIFLCYFHIFRVARSQARKVDSFDASLFTAPPVKTATHRRQSAASTSSRASSMILYLRRHFSTNNLWGKASRAVTRSLRQSRAYKTVIAIIGCFLTCWTPCVILLLYTMFYAPPAYYIEFTVVLFAFLNYILNPLICVTLNKDFRRGVKKCLGLRRRQLVRQAIQAFASTVMDPGLPKPTKVIKVMAKTDKKDTSTVASQSLSTNDESQLLNPATLDVNHRGSASVRLPISKAYAD